MNVNSRRLLIRIGSLLLMFLPAAAPSPAQSKDKLVGVPLNRKVPLVLNKDLGFGKKYRHSLTNDFQDWGVQQVSRSDGFPVRLGKYSLRFETREGYCGWDKGWNDCRNGRSRHELSTAVYGHDPWNKDRWYALSLFIPEDYNTTRRIKTSIFQFWAGGQDSWMFKYDTGRGFYVQQKRPFSETVIISPSASLNRWNDFVIRIRHSMKSDGVLGVWVNGKAMYQFKGRTAAGDRPSRKPYFKFGIYNTAMGSNGAPIDGGGFGDGKGLPNHVLYFDEVRSGPTCKSLKLADLGYDCARLTQ